MDITPLSAASEVTGSAYLVESNDAKILINCGMFQGGKKQDAKNRPPKQQYIKHLDSGWEQRIVTPHCTQWVHVSALSIY